MLPWTFGLLVKGTLFLVAAGLVALGLRRASAALRHLVWATGIGALLVLPFCSALLPWRVPILKPMAAAPSPRAAAGNPISLPPAGAAEPAQRSASAGPHVLPGPRATGVEQRPASPPGTGAPIRPPMALLLLAAWATGALIVILRLAVGAALVHRMLRRATRLETPDWTRPLVEAADRLALPRLPRLVRSDRMPMPFACGLLRPTIVVPASAADWSDGRRRAVLAHELAHVRRSDLLVNGLGQLVCAIYWFHPLAWMALQRLRIESERACDDLVLGVGTRASEYADHLLQIVCRAARTRTPALALPMAQRREFEGRMLAILERNARRGTLSRRGSAAFAMLAALVVLPLAAAVPVRAEPAAGPAVAERVSAPGAPAVATRADTGQTARITPAPSRTSVRKAKETHRRSVTHTEVSTETETASAASTPMPTNTSVTADSVSDQVTRALVKALGDSVASVREDAAYALGRREATAATTPLTARVLQDPDAKVREMAVWALAQIGSRSAVRPLGSAVLHDSSAAVRAMAVWALGRLEDTASVRVLAAAVRDQAREVRRRAAWALGTIAPREAPTPLIAALRDPSPDVREPAAWALGQIADPTAVPALVGTLSDSSRAVRRAGIWALGQMETDTARTALIQALQASDPEVRAAAARALGGGHVNPWPWPWPMPIIR